MTIHNLQEKYWLELSHIHDSEHRLVAAQQEMHARATDPALKKSIEKHLAQTQGQIANLHQIYALLGHETERGECGICTALLENIQTGLQVGDDSLRDCFIGGAATMVEHYEIGVYSGLINEAQLMGQSEIVQLLQQNLKQEQESAQIFGSNERAVLQIAKQHEASLV